MRHPLSLVCMLSLLSVGSAAFAQAKATPTEPVLHEYIPAIRPEEAELRERPAPIGRAAPQSSPDSSDEGTRASRAPTPNSQGFRPDRQTSLEGGLDYYEAFNPSIAPFKRMTAFDDVRLDGDGKTPVLGVRDPQLRAVPIESAAARARDKQHRDAFVGELDLDFRHERLLALPSISPDSRIYALHSEPAVNLQVLRDGADNFFVRVRGPVPDAPVHLRWETDAPRSYFGTEIPAVPLRELRKLPGPAIDASIEHRALRFAGELGISTRSDLRSALAALTRHFRSFVESAESPANSGDLYLDLCHAQKGLCRHRAYGFVVTARALGIAARFVQNEAHSWVEVELPDVGHVRIDLGGATHGLTAHDLAERQSYVPAQPDTLPRPEAYRQSYAQAARQQQRGATPDNADLLASLSGRWLSDDSLRGPTSEGSQADAQQDTSNSTQPKRRPVRIALEDKRINALRGGKLVLTGQIVADGGRAAAGLRVEVWILRPTLSQRMLLAVQVTDEDGYFRADFGVPPDLSVGDYRLIARTQGDATHLPATTE